MKLIGDPILVRSNELPAYNYAVVIDDSLMEITHVIRGEDHISNTPRQILIYKALSLTPPQFVHLSLVMGKDNTRLSKRHGATAIDQFEAVPQLALQHRLFVEPPLKKWPGIYRCKPAFYPKI